MSKLVFFCKSKSYAPPHAIMFDSKTKQVACDCPYFQHTGFCSHIDATLIAGERAMIEEEEDRQIADEIMKKMKGRIKTPPDWKASWREDLEWRGLRATEVSVKTVWYRNGKAVPSVCFTGSDPKNPKKPRSAYLEEAEAKGFHACRKFNKSIDIVVAPSPLINTNKANGAAELNIPVLSYDDWAVLTSDGEFVEDASQIKLDALPTEEDKVTRIDLYMSQFRNYK